MPEDEPEPARGLALALETHRRWSRRWCSRSPPGGARSALIRCFCCWTAGDVGVATVAAACSAESPARSSDGSAGRVPSADGEGEVVGTACSATLMVTADRYPVRGTGLADCDAEVVGATATRAADR